MFIINIMRIYIYILTSLVSAIVAISWLIESNFQSLWIILLCSANLILLMLTIANSFLQLKKRKQEELQYGNLLKDKISLKEQIASKDSEYYNINVKVQEIFNATYDVIKKIKQEVSLSFVFSDEVKKCVSQLHLLIKEHHDNYKNIRDSVSKSKDCITLLNDESNQFRGSITDLQDEFKSKYKDLNLQSGILLTMKDKIVSINGLTIKTMEFMENMGNYAAEEKALVDQITDEADMAARQIEDLQEAIQTINDITEKTRLLSINAMIESTKVQSESKKNGFAIVAKNIRELSNNSQKSINKIIHDIPIIVKKIITLISKFKRSAELFNAISGMINLSIQLTDRQGNGIKELVTYADGINLFIQNLSNSFKNLGIHFATIQDLFSSVNEKSNISREIAENVDQTIKDSIDKLELIYNNIIIIEQISKANTKSLDKVDELASKFKI